MKTIRLALLSAPFAACVLFLSGCVTALAPHPKSVEVASGVTTTIDRVSGTNLAIASANPLLDQNIIAAATAKHEEDSSVTQAKLQKIRDDLEKQRAEMKDLLTNMVQIGGAAIGGTINPSNAVAQVFKTFVDKDKEAKTEVKADVHETKKALEADINKVKTDIEVTRSKVTEATTALADKTMEFQSKFASLSEEQREKINQQVGVELAAAGLSETQIQALKTKAADDGMDLAGWLATGGAGALGLGALARTLGKSRGQKEIDELWDITKDLEVKTTEVKVAKEMQAKLEAHLADLERRMSR
ncbi:hypothetical protein [Synoicihabitans lomoniglobus]|uniref:Lipoprotein n=1 Tax=Synoicihabitans lomoniglobus TaxID=2909285 RepID=A0AAF0CS09_9BACT|nr:hypothetical protein [Opitutaceae bacterium LMO-M01]WED66921.1 hypothetical protein PXH66_08665 [Opitutaceae bacterium LMO-M01]